jgi:hypothetical protein
MSSNEMMALKLQMGINPLAPIAPNMLLAMWQQLKLERSQFKASQSKAASYSNQET